MPSSIVSNLELSRNPPDGPSEGISNTLHKNFEFGLQSVFSGTLVTSACPVLVLPYFFRTIVTPSFLGLSASPALGVHSKDAS
jgi:hypothetical protein